MKFNSYCMLKFYEDYYSNIKPTLKIISDDNFTYRNILWVVNRHLPLVGNVLDIGSGVGTIDFYLANKGYNVDGIELSKRAFQQAIKTRNYLSLEKKINFYNISIEKYNTLKKYKIVICSEVLEHLENDKEILKKIYNIMAKESILILTVPSINAPLYRWGLLEKFDKKVGHLRRYNEADIKNKIIDTGFKLKQIYIFEGIFRNLLYTNDFFSILVRLTKLKFFNKFFTFVDVISKYFFGASQIVVVAVKL